MWGMGNYMYMFPDRREYEYYQSFSHAVVSLDTPPTIRAGQSVKLAFRIKEEDGSPATLFIDMEKRVHVVFVSEDQTVFAHVHPDDTAPLTPQEIQDSSFTVTHTFPKAGKYLVSFDYAHGLKLESKQFTIEVTDGPAQMAQPVTYPDSGRFGGYDVTLDPGQPLAGQVNTIVYKITKDGKPVTDLVPYLSAAMHVSVVKNDFTAFVHVHGELHPPGQPYPPIIVKDGQVIHSMSSMYVPPQFSSPVEAHLIFPTAGLYTVWGEFKVGDKVIPTSFTVQVQ